MDSKTAKKIEVVPCPIHRNGGFLVTEQGDDYQKQLWPNYHTELKCCGTEAEAQAKAAELEMAAACKEIAEVSQAKRAAQPTETRPPQDEQVEYMVSRFLQWRLPEDFNPDCGISFKPTFNENTSWGPDKHRPVGTNLFDHTQAKAMVLHMIEGLPARAAAPVETPRAPCPHIDCPNYESPETARVEPAPRPQGVLTCICGVSFGDDNAKMLAFHEECPRQRFIHDKCPDCGNSQPTHYCPKRNPERAASSPVARPQQSIMGVLRVGVCPENGCAQTLPHIHTYHEMAEHLKAASITIPAAAAPAAPVVEQRDEDYWIAACIHIIHCKKLGCLKCADICNNIELDKRASQRTEGAGTNGIR